MQPYTLTQGLYIDVGPYFIELYGSNFLNCNFFFKFTPQETGSLSVLDRSGFKTNQYRFLI